MTRRPAVGHRLLDLLRATPELAAGGRWLVGVSGGADSIALLHALGSLGSAIPARFVVAHLHHGLRGAAADADARFVARVAARFGWPCVVERADVRALAAAHGWSVEQAAREARLDFFRRELRRRRARGVLLAHTRDDQAETLLIRLLRGAGGQGLGGMRANATVRGLCLLRPLLGVARADLRDYLKRAHQRWREDASNADPRHLRNVIRHRVLPLLEEVTGRQLAAPLARTAALLADEESHWSDLVHEAVGRCGAGPVWRVDHLAREPLALQRRLLLAALWSAGNGGDFEAVERVRALLAVEQGQVDIGGGLRAVRSGGALRLEPGVAVAVLPEVELVIGREIRAAAWGLAASCRKVRATGVPVRGRPGVLPARVFLDERRVEGVRLAIRPWRAGDRMRPAGGRGSRKLQDLFADAKLPRADRHRIPVLVAEDQPIWMPGFRVAEGWGGAARNGHVLKVVLRRLP
jgi:tRNA(Ile)-lysidine synthase